jgi:universal stress protein A
MTKILVPIDYSDHSLAVLEYAGTFARGLNARLSVLYVWETMPHFAPTLVVTTPSGPRPLFEIVQENAASEMKEFLSRAKSTDSIPLETHIDSGPAAAKILQWITEHHFDLVIVGTHGRGGIKHWVLGSVAERIVRLSPVPVITIPERHRAVRTGAPSPSL